jgi:divalent metal cation (Fe/Co/Zn/Cd) transporter
MHIVVDGSISVRVGHAIADEVENKIIDRIPNALEVVVHVDPSDVVSR